MEHLIDDNILYMPNCERAICEKIFHVVIIHRRCIELVYFTYFCKIIGFFKT